jgi:predicted transcriptional regulator
MKLFTVEHVHRWESSSNSYNEIMLGEILKELKLINKQNREIMLTQEQLLQGLNDVTAQVGKIKGESTVMLQKVTDLENALGNQGNVSPAVEEAFNALKAQVQVVDDLIADAPTTTVEPPAEGGGL